MRFLNSIKIKILVVSICLAAIPVIVASTLLGLQATSSAEHALEEQVTNQLTSIRAIKKQQLENFLKDMERKVATYSIDAGIVTQMIKFSTYYNTDKRQLTDVSAQTTSLSNFYNGQFAEHFQTLNGTKPAPADQYLAQLDKMGIALQNSYLAVNDVAFGKKHNLINPEDGTTYATAHDEAHRVLKGYFNKIDVEDMYLVDPKGNVVYSVQKNPDFATNLREGPYKESNLARAYVAAIDSKSYEFVAVSDIEPYAGNFNQPSMFIASPIQDLDEEDAFEILGVLVFKIKLSAINDIMSSQRLWEDIGMGNSGEVYLVGQDKTLRSNYRALIEDKAEQISQLQNAGLPADKVNLINLQSSTANRVRVDNALIDLALQGESGAGQFVDSFGNEIIAAYSSIKFHDIQWAIISGIHTSEAFSAKTALSNKINLTGIIITVAMLAVAVVVGILFATMITKPIIKMSRTMSRIEQTSDLTERIDVDNEDEIGTMAVAMNHMLEKFRKSLEQVAASTSMLATSSEEMSAITQQTSDNVNKQFSEIDQIATAINEMTATVQEVAANATNAAQAAATSSEQASSGKTIVESTMSSISETSNELENVAQIIEKLNKDSENIGAVMDVIKGIAEQTNLLALNAAIEAARAGEQGRGFAVVADEVRTLASRTQQSTGEIEHMITELQNGASTAVKAVTDSLAKSQQSVNNAAAAGDSLSIITRSISEINDMNTMIAAAAEEQSAVTEEINKNIVGIRVAAEETTSGAQNNNASSEELSRLSTELQQLVAQFKTA